MKVHTKDLLIALSRLLAETVTNYIKTCNRNIFDKQSTCNKIKKYNICLSYSGVVGNGAYHHCLLCKGTSTGILLKK